MFFQWSRLGSSIISQRQVKKKTTIMKAMKAMKDMKAMKTQVDGPWMGFTSIKFSVFRSSFLKYTRVQILLSMELAKENASK